MKRTKYKVTFYTIKGVKFVRVCTRTYSSTLKYAIKIALKQCAIFYIKKHKNSNDSKRVI